MSNKPLANTFNYPQENQARCTHNYTHSVRTITQLHTRCTHSYTHGVRTITHTVYAQLHTRCTHSYTHGVRTLTRTVYAQLHAQCTHTYTHFQQCAFIYISIESSHTLTIICHVSFALCQFGVNISS